MGLPSCLLLDLKPPFAIRFGTFASFSTTPLLPKCRAGLFKGDLDPPCHSTVIGFMQFFLRPTTLLVGPLHPDSTAAVGPRLLIQYIRSCPPYLTI